ncbi:hypothetical protein [Frankia sp. Cr1]|uniref:hypothetical protein n=1 Tax=Frankia sp. Cr1 TaxID=3073931 RepID=UPI002AD4F589|nr:hypothetical protein [Frankia sp. Cr1]
MWSAVDVALQAAGAVHRMEATAFVVLSASTATYQRTTGALPGLDAGLTLPRSESVGARVLDGAPVALTEVSDEPAVAGTDEPARLGVRSYVAVAVLGGDGRLHGLLVGLDRAQVTLAPSAIILLRGIADAVGALMDDAEHVFEHSFEHGFEDGTEAVPKAVPCTPKRPRPAREQRTAHPRRRPHRHRRNLALRRGRAGPHRGGRPRQVTGHPRAQRQHVAGSRRCACAGRRPDGSSKVPAAMCGRSATCCPRWSSPICSPRTSPRPAGPDGPIMI